MKRGALVVAVVASGCWQEVLGPEDAGEDGAADAGTDAATDAGTDAATDAATDAGTDAGAALPPLVWGEMPLPENTRPVHSVFITAGGTMFAGTENGKILLFSQIDGWTVRATMPSQNTVRALWSDLFHTCAAGEGGAFYYHDGNDWTSYVGDQVSRFNAMAGPDRAAVYAAAGLTNGTALFKFTEFALPRQWETTGELLSIHEAQSGVYYIGATAGRIFRWTSSGAVPQTVDYPQTWGTTEIASMSFNGIGSDGANLFAVGYRHLIFMRESDGVWRPSYMMYRANDLYAAAGGVVGGEPEAYAVGRTVAGGPIVRWYRGEWKPVNYPNDYDLWAIAKHPSRDEYIAVGGVKSNIIGKILIGTRPGN